jgi:hypothetical protein
LAELLQAKVIDQGGRMNFPKTPKPQNPQTPKPRLDNLKV